MVTKSQSRRVLHTNAKPTTGKSLPAASGLMVVTGCVADHSHDPVGLHLHQEPRGVVGLQVGGHVAVLLVRVDDRLGEMSPTRVRGNAESSAMGWLL